jgi:SPASM domain peptide maturase of grasp-with-spasm system
MNTGLFKRFSHIFPVRGYNRGILYDLGRKTQFLVPNSFIEFLEACDHKTKDEVTSLLQPQGIYPVDYFEFLKAKEIGFWTSTPHFFPPLSTRWQSPSDFTNLIWDVQEQYLARIVSYIQELNIKAIHLRFSHKNLRDILPEVLQAFAESPLKSIEVAFNFSERIDSTFLTDLLYENPRVSIFIGHSANTEKLEYLDEKKVHYYISTKSPLYYNRESCLVNRFSFKVDTELFKEAQSHHTYFNKKLYINEHGEIKNAPECKEVLGNVIDTTNPKDLLAFSGLKKLNKVTKMTTDVCKDCEFRYMCIDNREPLERATNEWFHEKPCNYNPYISKWKDEEDYQPLSACGVVSSSEGFTIDSTKISALNQRIWQNA